MLGNGRPSHPKLATLSSTLHSAIGKNALFFVWKNPLHCAKTRLNVGFGFPQRGVPLARTVTVYGQEQTECACGYSGLKGIERKQESRVPDGGYLTHFVKVAGLSAAAMMLGQKRHVAEAVAQYDFSRIPSYLRGYEEVYATNPRKAAVEWFRNARFGLFLWWGQVLHYDIWS